MQRSWMLIISPITTQSVRSQNLHFHIGLCWYARFMFSNSLISKFSKFSLPCWNTSNVSESDKHSCNNSIEFPKFNIHWTCFLLVLQPVLWLSDWSIKLWSNWLGSRTWNYTRVRNTSQLFQSYFTFSNFLMSMFWSFLEFSFDDEGRQTDQDGKLVDWWDKWTLENFTRKAQCFIDQYGSFFAPEVNITVNLKPY